MGFVPCGLREFMSRLGHGIGARAASLRSERGLRFTFIVPKGVSGVFGPDVEYMELPALAGHIARVLPVVKGHLFHAPHQYCTFKYLKGIPRQLLTVHDINFEHTKQGARLKRARARFEGRLRHATHLAYISDFSRADVENHFATGSRPARVIYNGVKDYRPMVTDRGPAFADGWTATDGFLFHLSSLEPYKNPGLLVEMMKHLPQMQLVVAGRWEKNPELRPVADAMPNVHTLGYVTEEEKAWLYAHCSAFLFPSIAEGFGLPPVEVMKFGTPVFLSRFTSLPEVGGDAAYYWDTLEPEAMAAEVSRRLASAPDVAALQANAARFDWERCAADYIDYYTEILNS